MSRCRFLEPWHPMTTHYRLFLLGLLAICLPAEAGEPPEGMAWIHGDTFQMGSNRPESRKNEQPPHTVIVHGFWMDAHVVTNAEFAKFVAATGYQTTAERPVDWEQLKKQLPEGTPKPAEEMLHPGSLVFTP